MNALDATSVALVGDFNGWDPNARQLRKKKSGGWWVTIRLAPGVYQYKFVINGIEWREDPENPRRELNNYGTLNSICEVV
jgi:1,4-alpha-glucan branching enzyme